MKFSSFTIIGPSHKNAYAYANKRSQTLSAHQRSLRPRSRLRNIDPMASSTVAILSNMEKHGVPDHLMDHVAENVHRTFFRDISAQIQNRFTAFEQLFMEYNVPGIEFMDKVRELYPDVRLYVDEYFDWGTVVIRLTDTRFVMCHEYKEMHCRDYKHIYMEGEMQGNTVVVSRFMYRDMYANLYYNDKQYDCHNAEAYFNRTSVNYIPFQFLNASFGRGMAINDNWPTFVNEANPKVWASPVPIVEWILANENQFADWADGVDRWPLAGDEEAEEDEEADDHFDE